MKKKMLRFVGILGLSIAMGAGIFGCSEQMNSESVTPDIQDIEPVISDIQGVELGADDGIGSSGNTEDGQVESNANGEKDIDKENSESVYYDGADLNGRVLEFSDTGFTMTPIYTEVFADGTRNSWEAAPGHEKEEDNIYVTYTEDTVFEVVYFSMSLQEETSREEADKSSIKNQTVVYVFGSSEDGKNWIADKVLIQRWD